MLLTDRGQPYLSSVRLQARAVTLNNLGCLMKKWGKPRVAIAYLTRALRIEAVIPGGGDNPAGTHLNMSAALSEVGMHREAVGHAGRAVDLAARATEAAAEQSESSASAAMGAIDEGNQEEEAVLQDPKESNKSNADSGGSSEHGSMTANRGGLDEQASSRHTPWSQDDRDLGRGGRYDSGPGNEATAADCFGRKSRNSTAEEDHSRGDDDDDDDDDGLVETQQEHREAGGGLLAIAYFNLAVEREHLGQMDAALDAYEVARVVADEHLGRESSVAKGIKQAIVSASNSRESAASVDRRRREHAGVASLPCIGKLQLSARSAITTPRARTRVQGDTINLSHQQRNRSNAGVSWNSESAGSRVRSSRNQDIVLAYTSARTGPIPPPCRSCRLVDCAQSPRRPTTAYVSRASRSCRERRDDEACPKRQAMLWRAQACAAFDCSPREALYAQQVEERELMESGGVGKNDEFRGGRDNHGVKVEGRG